MPLVVLANLMRKILIGVVVDLAAHPEKIRETIDWIKGLKKKK